MEKRSIIRYVKITATIVLTSIAIGFTINSLLGGTIHFSLKQVFGIVVISLGIGVPMWLGNSLIGSYMNRHMPWTTNPSKALRWNILVSTLYNTVALFGITTFIYYFFAKESFCFKAYFQNIIVTTFIVSLISFCIWGVMFIRKFVEVYKAMLLKEERYKRDIAVYQFEMLKNQVNPHFLFNSLNVLTSLVETDTTAATKFIRKLSEVYRYVLDVKDRELVPLADELRLTEAYLFMQQYRYGSSIRTSIEVDPSGRQIIPLALQMLVENAIKHNIISKEHPLTISIYTENDYLICTNNLQPKTAVEESNIGLRNIKERYEYLNAKPMFYGVEGGNFVVKLPTL